jgi:isoleucyl-tRNA synthetase
MAPFTPFLTEFMYRNLRHLVANQKAGTTESVHFLSTPEPKYKKILQAVINIY